MFGHLEIISILFFIGYIVILAIIIWLFYRFVQATESIADSLRQWVFLQRREQEE